MPTNAGNRTGQGVPVGQRRQGAASYCPAVRAPRLFAMLFPLVATQTLRVGCECGGNAPVSPCLGAECPDGGGDSGADAGGELDAGPDAGIDAGFPLLVTVDPVYPSNPKWNDYVRNNNSAQDVFHQADVACTGTESGSYSACIHGGEKRKVTLTGVATCAGLTLTDSLGAFDWVCRDASGTATFYSVGLKGPAGLKDLVDAASWKPDSVTVRSGAALIASSAPATWWSNNVQPLPSNSAATAVVLDGAYLPGTIFTASTDQSTGGYNLAADRLGLVLLSGHKLTFNGTANTCNSASGTAIAPDQPRMICAGNRKFLWLEGGVLDGAFTAQGSNLLLVSVNFSVLTGLTSQRSQGYGIELASCAGNRLSQLTILDNASNGLVFDGASLNNTLLGLTAAGNRVALWLNGGSGYLVRDVYLGANPTIQNNFEADNVTGSVLSRMLSAGGNFLFSNSSQNVITHVTAFNCFNCLELGTSSSNTVAFVTVANDINDAIDIVNGSTHNTVVQAVGVNNQDIAIWGTPSSDNNSFAQLASANSGVGLDIYSFGNVFSGNLLVGSNSSVDCNAAAGDGGLVSGSCANQGASSATLVTGIDLTNSFVAKVTADDAVNVESSSLVPYDNIVDWTGFANRYRGWGKEGGAFPNTNHRDACASGQTCRIWDWRLRAASKAGGWR